MNADLISTHEPTKSNGYKSKMEIDSSSIAPTPDLAIKITNAHPDDTVSPDGSADNNSRFIFKINNHYYVGR